MALALAPQALRKETIESSCVARTAGNHNRDQKQGNRENNDGVEWMSAVKQARIVRRSNRRKHEPNHNPTFPRMAPWSRIIRVPKIIALGNARNTRAGASMNTGLLVARDSQRQDSRLFAVPIPAELSAPIPGCAGSNLYNICGRRSSTAMAGWTEEWASR